MKDATGHWEADDYDIAAKKLADQTFEVFGITDGVTIAVPRAKFEEMISRVMRTAYEQGFDECARRLKGGQP